MRLIALSLFIVFSLSLNAQKRELNEEAYRSWRRVDDYKLSDNGKWVVYRYLYTDNDSGNISNKQIYYLYQRDGAKTIRLDNVASPHFFAGGEWMMYTSTDSAATGNVAMCLKTQRTYACPQDAEPNARHPYISYLTPENTLVIKTPGAKDSLLLTHIGRYSFYGNDRNIIYTRQHSGRIEICYGAINSLRNHKQLYCDTTERLERFLFSPFTESGQFRLGSIYTFSLKSGKVECAVPAEEISAMGADASTIEIVSDRYLRYARQAPRRVRPETVPQTLDFELELWSWNDPIVPSQQAISGFYPRIEKTPDYIYDRHNKTSLPLPFRQESNLQISPDANPLFAYLIDETPYVGFKDWQHDLRFDLYAVDLRTGKEHPVAKALTRTVSWSPDGKFILFFDNITLSWTLYHPETQQRRCLRDEIHYPLHDELYDRPNPAPPYGIAGWSNDNRYLLVYDRYDIWAVDLQNSVSVCCTKGFGRLHKLQFRMIDPGQNGLRPDLSKSIYLTSWNEDNKNSGIYRLTPDGKLTCRTDDACELKILAQAENPKTALCFRQSYRQGRDLWLTDDTYGTFRKITDANPQQAEYAWGSVRQVKWTNYEGNENRGLLYLPDGYDSTRSYPTIVSFYETHTPEMHIYLAPGLSQSMIDIPTYVSKGYVVFQPDVYFKIGKPGQSSYDAVVSGTQALIERGIIDSARVGLQGHSWSGFQSAYLVTRTNLFKCVNIGAPLTNFTSAYTALRLESGVPCMLMYEDWQCRMGASLWDDLPGYIENSPVLHADKIHTPALIFHCDGDGSVTFDDGRSLFLALRRLQRPAWLLNYKGEGHSLTSRPAMVDWTIRMEQFFNHYLRGAALPRWMQEGINIRERKTELKYE